MHPKAAGVVRRAIASGARIDPIADFDALDALHRAATAASSLPLWRELDLLDRPVVVGDFLASSGEPAVLYPLSWAARWWIRDSAAAWFGADREVSDLAVAWAMAQARNPDAFRGPGAEPGSAYRAIMGWSRTRNCGTAALFRAVQSLLRRGADKPKEEAASPAGEDGNDFAIRLVLARVVQEFGQDDDYWMFGPEERLAAALDLLRRQDEAADRAIADKRGAACAPDPLSPEILSIRAWCRARDEFLAKMTRRCEESGGRWTDPGQPVGAQVGLAGGDPAGKLPAETVEVPEGVEQGAKVDQQSPPADGTPGNAGEHHE